MRQSQDEGAYWQVCEEEVEKEDEGGRGGWRRRRRMEDGGWKRMEARSSINP